MPVWQICNQPLGVNDWVGLGRIRFGWDMVGSAELNRKAALPTVLLKASLLARMAERCQRHVLKEALHLLWKLLCLKILESI